MFFLSLLSSPPLSRRTSLLVWRKSAAETEDAALRPEEAGAHWMTASLQPLLPRGGAGEAGPGEARRGCAANNSP